MIAEKKFRIILWGISSTGWRGDQKAVVYDAKSIGIEEHANDSGSAYWTLDNDHPQISEFVPLARHYEISRYSDQRDRWEFVGAGMLNDYNVTEYQTTFSGLDYKAVLNQVYTPLSGMTVDNATPIADTLTTGGVDTYSGDIPFRINSQSSTTALRYINGSVPSVDGPYTYSVPGTLRKLTTEEFNNIQDGTGVYINDPFGYVNGPTYYETPYIELSWTGIWSSATTAGFGDAPFMFFRIYCSPPGYKDAGEPPLGNLGLIGDTGDAELGPGTMFNGATWGDYLIKLYPQELKTLVEKEEGVGSFLGKDYIDFLTELSGNDTDVACLRPGISYSFQIYAAIYRTTSGNPIYYRSTVGAINGSTLSTSPKFGEPAQVTLGQSTEDASNIISRVFNNVTTSDQYGRLRYASLVISGSTATTHTTYTAGEPVLDHIASVCDLEMGAKTDGSKVVFGINKPTSGSSYDGNFKLNLSVSSSASTSMALRYPDNIRSFSFTPGYARVRNDITIIPTTAYLSGSSGQTDGSNLIGATAMDQTSVTANGRIPLIVPKANLVDGKAAQNEANRMLETYKVANTKQVNIRAVLDGVDLWNGWDVGDSVKLTVNRGLAVVDEPFVITGVRWFGESDGHERIELDLMQGTAFAAAYTAPIPTTEAS